MEDFTDSSAEATVEDMDTPFLTISEAAEKTGRSLSTIRRLIKSIADDDAHADRAAIQPTPKEVVAFKKKEENFAWKIREDVLLREFKGALKEAKKETAEARSDILGILQKELDLKNQQIEKQWEVIHSLNDRLREGNILMGTLQKRLVLAAPEVTSDVVDAASTPVTSTEAAVKASVKDSAVQSKGIFAWFSR
jgi:Asp-tRNA(Asn)/Glu-tRNA(Gln) amidotransferase C subunit